jgi:hypothetical protein
MRRRDRRCMIGARRARHPCLGCAVHHENRRERRQAAHVPIVECPYTVVVWCVEAALPQTIVYVSSSRTVWTAASLGSHAVVRVA